MEEKEGAQRRPCGNADESTHHIVGEHEFYREERNVVEEGMRKIDGCDIEKLAQ